MNSFPTSVSAESLIRRPAPPDPEKARKLDFQKFWFLCVPLGAVLALGLSILILSNVFLPATAVFSVIIWGVMSTKEEK
jgi:hypothetical protein